MPTLADGTEVSDSRLGRLKHFDERSRAFPVRAVIEEKKLRSFTWRCLPNFDQGREGACVAFGIGHELAARPSEVEGINYDGLIAIYHEAQRTDPWEGGSYPGASPRYDGTSVLAGVKVVQKQGYFSEYRWAFTFRDLQLGIGRNGPCVIGVDWRTGMFDTDSNGFIHATGQVEGGHCTLLRGVNIKEKYFLGRNSWGAGWGQGGDFKISFADMEKLMSGGEFVFFQKRKMSV